ncbi:hypothetical protein ACFO25_10060 [Paenactinomyces guangxiensis]|uniref:Uncharacterized protein n=1 Tax=Paenactinomyces guangxiensis TaxID=1490290 RepID=A0A7W1WS92_9BACL|nr:hypothetical protein [Paenactinomyces guangxiensis]MBA4495129.1 hypothetical protein [Paenactinomyces guangxiensis]MBH8592187.1 hypothetical protein [Paenactinomyces guangxiensis]
MAYNNYGNKNKGQGEKKEPEYLETYATVNERLMKFREDYPEGIIDPEIIKWTDDGLIVIQVKIYKNPEDFKNGIFAAKAHAYEKDGTGYINKGSALENCETSAIGRALAHMGYDIKKSIASREEVANAVYRREQEQVKKEQPQRKQEQAQTQQLPQKQAQPAEKKEPIKPKTLGEIKVIWMRLGYKAEDLGRQLKNLYGVNDITRLSEEQAQEFLGKLKDLEETRKKQLFEEFKQTVSDETQPDKKTA